MSKIDWTKIEEGLHRVTEGPFAGAVYERSLGVQWVTWRGMTVNLGRYGGIQDASVALHKHPCAPKYEEKTAP